MKIGIFGAGGFGREVLPEVRAAYPEADIVFVVDTVDPANASVNGAGLISLDQAIAERRLITIAVADWQTRRRISEIIETNGLKQLDVIARDTKIYDHLTIGSGAIICANSMITSNVSIGRCFHLNIYSYVAHDCIIGDFVTFAPRVCCNGNVTVKRGAYIGTGAVLKQGSRDRPLVIGEGAVVGMGAVVTKDVLPGDTVIGNPARSMNSR